jgi:hypothetical protein
MKKIIIPILLIVLLGAGIGGYLFLNKPTSEVKPQDATTQTVTENKPTEGKTSDSFVGTVTDLMKKTIPQKCEATYTEKTSEFKGTYYFNPSVKKTRMDIVSTVDENGKTMEFNTHMIIDETYAYSWMDGQKTGMKISVVVPTTNGTPKTEASQLNKQVSFTCTPWIVDGAMFELPGDVQFTDASAIGDMMKNIKIPQDETPTE